MCCEINPVYSEDHSKVSFQIVGIFEKIFSLILGNERGGKALFFTLTSELCEVTSFTKP